ncbi:aquaporin [Paraburkholderia sp. CNPSo 3274]|uniref:aquaporin n=1 Tax=Paraburkholderia sp. CNPSo 3274 TaxID=2940932 RepID=UPI0020B8E9FF|nr:aquaporin [Paraburkholderia sp. CNPSo 3274]MCP3709063.1 aquaporin [Paraburkholderia sp. CNPSo 3274]
MKLGRRLAVEGAGTAWLVFAGCAATRLNASPSAQGFNVVEMAAAFGLALPVANYAAARAASAHFNPAVTIGYTVSGRFPVRDTGPYLAAQTIGAILGAASLVRAAGGRPGFSVAVSDLGSSGYDDHSPTDYALAAVCLLELAQLWLFWAAPLLGGAAAGMAYRLVSRRSRIVSTLSRNGV